MNLQIVGAGIFKGEELNGFQIPPAWRKATRNMVMATASIERALAQASGLKIAADPGVGLVLSSASGELDTSVDFITTFAKSGLARPVLFQNSLHNATTGFASIHFKIVGPVFTLSSLESAPEEAIEMAATLLEGGACRVCLVTLVEGHKAVAERMGEASIHEGACSLVLTTSNYAQESGLQTLAELPRDRASLNYTAEPRTAPLIAADGSGIFRWAAELGVRP